MKNVLVTDIDNNRLEEVPKELKFYSYALYAMKEIEKGKKRVQLFGIKLKKW